MAALNHPAVLALYDVGEADGVAVPGDRAPRGRDAARAAGGGARSPASASRSGAPRSPDALAAAHAPRASFTGTSSPRTCSSPRDGRLKVLDFGLAKELAVTSGSPEDATLSAPTGAGIVLGTRGLPVSRAGAGGRRRRAAATSSRRAACCTRLSRVSPPSAGIRPRTTSPRSLETTRRTQAAIRADAPHGLTRVVERCLAKEPEARGSSPRATSPSPCDRRGRRRPRKPRERGADDPRLRGRALLLPSFALGLAGLRRRLLAEALLRGSRAGRAVPHRRARAANRARPYRPTGSMWRTSPPRETARTSGSSSWEAVRG